MPCCPLCPPLWVVPARVPEILTPPPASMSNSTAPGLGIDGGVLAHELRRALRLLPEEEVADVLEDLEARTGDEPGDHVSVVDGEHLVECAVHDERGRAKLGKPRARVVPGDRAHLLHDHWYRHAVAQAVLEERRVDLLPRGKARRHVDLPGGTYRAFAVTRGHA